MPGLIGSMQLVLTQYAFQTAPSRFYLSDVPIGVGIVGPGLIGGTLIDQIRDQVRGQH